MFPSNLHLYSSIYLCLLFTIFQNQANAAVTPKTRTWQVGHVIIVISIFLLYLLYFVVYIFIIFPNQMHPRLSYPGGCDRPHGRQPGCCWCRCFWFWSAWWCGQWRSRGKNQRTPNQRPTRPMVLINSKFTSWKLNDFLNSYYLN